MSLATTPPEDENGFPLPVAGYGRAARRGMQSEISAAELGQSPSRAVHVQDPGLLATIGRNAAVARLWGFSFSGFLAWLIWVALHIYRLVGFRNRLVVMLNWAWDYFFYESQVRLITKE